MEREELKGDQIRGQVRDYYAKAASKSGCGCAPASSCCSGEAAAKPGSYSEMLGYQTQELKNLPEGADLGLGCGNPTAIASLKPGEVVLDLGSGGGIDCFLAARKVGERGRVIGVDMTPEMVAKARENVAKGGFSNVEFRLGEIEHLPVADSSVDVIISNCVINLAPDKRPVYQEAFRALKPGGRLAISDIVATKPLPEAIRKDAMLWSSCAAGALELGETEKLLRELGFKQVKVTPIERSQELIVSWIGSEVGSHFVSATIEAVKP